MTCAGKQSSMFAAVAAMQRLHVINQKHTETISATLCAGMAAAENDAALTMQSVAFELRKLATGRRVTIEIV